MPAYRVKLIPESFQAESETDLRLELTCSEALSPGTTIQWQFPNAWLARGCQSFTKQYQWDDPQAADYISVTVPGRECDFELSVETREFDSGEPVSRHGRRRFSTLTQGTVPAGRPVVLEWLNTTASWIAESEHVYVAVDGEAITPLPEIITWPGEAVALRVIAPSAVAPRQRFTVRIVSLDRRDNCSCTRYRGEPLRGPDNQPLTRPLDFYGSCAVEVSLPEEGIYRLRYGEVLSNPIRVAPDPQGPYWGDIHIHTCYSADGRGRAFYEYARDVSGLDFAAAADHARTAILSWDTLKRLAEQFDEPGRFVTFLAYENGFGHPSGHHNNHYRTLEGKVYPRDEVAGDMRNVWPQLDPEECFTAPHHSGIAFGSLERHNGVNFEHEDQRFSPVAEIYSHHGQSELYDPHHELAYEVNRWHDPGERINWSVPGPHYLQDAWAMGLRLGVYGSSDDHNGMGGRRHQGIAAVFAPELTREALFQSFKRRACYATTGERILLEFTINGTAMGQEITAAPGDELAIRIAVYGTNDLSQVELLRLALGSGQYTTALNWRPQQLGQLDWETDLTEVFTEPVMYYLRVTQHRPINHRLVMAWSSPIWVTEE